MKALVGILCIVALTFICSAAAQASTFTAMGTVTDAVGNPVPNATVTMVDNNYKLVALTHTDPNGNFEFVNVEPGTATCKVLTTYTDSNGKVYMVPGEYSQWFAVEGVVMINETSTQLTDYSPAPFTAIGQVTDKNGNPVEGARVMLIDDNKKETAAVRSDANGNFEFAGVVPTTKNFTVSVLYINGSQSYKAASSRAYPEWGTTFIDRAETMLNDYPSSAMSPQAIATTTPVDAVTAEKSVNVNALAIALLIGILLLAGVYLILRKAL
ncbi:MAG TPA: carboxypeptidase-like regulatory domain-containing protein [Methanocellaceae archaeon]